MSDKTICTTCLRLKQGICDGEKELTVCPSYKRMTNADRIRAMTDEELADWLKYERISVCPPDTGHIHCNISDICADRKCWLDWLKQEVSDNG